MSKIDIGDINIHYQVFRKGKTQSSVDTTTPTLIVLHGGPGFVDHSLYTPFWSYLSIFMQVIFPDQRGNGLSDHGDQAKWTLDNCGKDVYSLCQALKIDKPIICGISWGGYVAMSYVSQYPSHPKALIFCNTEAKVSPEARKRMFTQLGGAEAGKAVWEYDHQPSKDGVHDNFIKHCMPHYARYRPYSKNDLLKCKTNFPMRKKFMNEENLKFDFRKSLNKVICPTLLLAGDCDAAHPLECAKETAKSIPTKFAKLAVIKDAGAPVYNDKPAIVYGKVLNFIAEVCESVAREMPKTNL